MDKREDTGNYYPGGTVVTGVPVPAPGGGASVEVVAPSPDGAGKAADAKAVYEGLEGKRDKTDLAVYEEQVSKPYSLADECLPILSHGAAPLRIHNNLANDGCIRVWETERDGGEPDIVIRFSEEVGYDGVPLVVEAVDYIEHVSGAAEYITFGGKPFKAGEWPRLKTSVVPSKDKILTAADMAKLPYSLVEATIDEGSVMLQDHAITKVIADDSVSSIAFIFPEKTEGYSRDFFIRLAITGETVPTLSFVEPNGDAVSFDVDDDSWAEIEQGVNILMFTDTEE